MVDDTVGNVGFVILQRMCLSCAIMEIWRLKHSGVTTLTFWVTWPFDSRWATSYGWSIVTIHLAPLLRYGHLKFFQEEWRLVVNITLISYTPRYV